MAPTSNIFAAITHEFFILVPVLSPKDLLFVTFGVYVGITIPISLSKWLR